MTFLFYTWLKQGIWLAIFRWTLGVALIAASVEELYPSSKELYQTFFFEQ